MALALNNLKRVDMPLNKETKPNLNYLVSCKNNDFGNIWYKGYPNVKARKKQRANISDSVSHHHRHCPDLLIIQTPLTLSLFLYPPSLYISLTFSFSHHLSFLSITHRRSSKLYRASKHLIYVNPSWLVNTGESEKRKTC